ncbi:MULTISPECIES: hypothetical protein [Pseudoalteromonas]|uniref:Uncharacterized protein n=1 Tax=Pseudoalteromonas rubra TaxID=43658 RepID=A0A5S3URS8_9GAMM|nr:MULTISPECIES: hypothetical protein [Pseudoalteromonas]MCG7560746.1 hypothetical protein [Pseudoalteromonas sp. McH1-42]MEC4090598.1 hypothetical protein [Pseudoalteromonas rubra]QPB82521.1 hypothetical protein CWC22_005760 [Pseudoalteromonas rubra]
MKKLILGCAMLIAGQAQAAWLTAGGSIDTIVVYANTNTILVTLQAGTSNLNNKCTTKSPTLAISSGLTEERRNRMYSMLLAKKASGQAVSLTYDSTAACEPWDSNSSAYSRILRMY